jgi:hypothetical protein
MAKKKRSKAQLKAIRKNYAIRSSKKKSKDKDTKTIFEFLLGVPGKGAIIIIAGVSLNSWVVMGVGVFISFLEVIQFSEALSRKLNALKKRFVIK